jgi:tetratricopeptide (TPR) repeat protein/glycosyltransferase involved in cell wall biosynthesis
MNRRGRRQRARRQYRASRGSSTQLSCPDALALALEHHRAGQWAEAEEVCRQLLHAHPDHPEALHLLGLLAHQAGKYDEAVQAFARAIAISPREPMYHNNLGLALWARRGLPAEASASFRRALALEPHYAEAYNNLGCLLAEQGGLDEAAASYRRALALKPDYAEAHNNLGLLLKNRGELDDAVESLRRALALKPDFAEAHSNLGLVFGEQGRHDEAAASLRRALALKPDFADAHSNLGLVLKKQGKHGDAADSLRRALALKPEHPDAHNNLGTVFHEQGRLDEALASLRRAVAVKPDYVEAYHNLGVVCSDAGDLDGSIASFRQALARRPDYADAHFGAGLSLLLQGRLEQGFAEYEWRWRCPDIAVHARRCPQPQWDGGPLGGRTILLHAEQGLGDAIQFARYAPLVAARGGRVVLECQPELAALLWTLSGADQVVSRGEQLPPFDVHAPLLSLPYLLGTTLETIPAEIPYLRADPDRVAAWAAHLAMAGGGDGGLRVGLVWAGNPAHKNDRRRSLTLDALRPLARVPGVRLFALQKGTAAGQTEAPPLGMALINLGPQLADFADTAAVIQQLDLVITVDTAVAHLAGALGRPVWVLLGSPPDWRWLWRGEDSPWYPTARLFRQERFGNWEGVIARVAAALGDLAVEQAQRLPAGRGVLLPRTLSEAPMSGGGANPAPVGAGATPDQICVAVPLGGSHGWGILGKYLARELSRLARIRLVTDPFTVEAVGDELDYHALQRLARTEPTGAADAAVLQAVFGTELQVYRPGLMGRLNVGYAVFEDNVLPPTAIQDARRHFDLMTVPSRWCRDVLRAHGLDDVRVVPHGIDPSIFHPSGAEKEYFRDSFVVFSGGKFELRKGQDLVIRAFKVLQDRHKDVLLVNAWSNPWQFSLETMRASPYIQFAPTETDQVELINRVLTDNGIDPDRVVTLRARPNIMMSRVYRNTDVGLFPNRCEGGNNMVLMEYMACGKPVIASHTSGHQDIVHGENAVLIRTKGQATLERDGQHIATWDEPDLEATIEQLEWAYQHRERLREIGERAGQDLAKLTWESTARQFYEILTGDGPRASSSSATSVDVKSSSQQLVPAEGPAELHRLSAGPNGTQAHLPSAHEALLSRLERSPEYAAVHDRLADPRPADVWHQDGLHFMAFELRRTDRTAVNGCEPPTVVFATHPISGDLISAVVVTPRSNGQEAEITSLRNQPESRRTQALRPSRGPALDEAPLRAGEMGGSA